MLVSDFANVRGKLVIILHMDHTENNLQFIHKFMGLCTQSLSIETHTRQFFRHLFYFGFVPERSNCTDIFTLYTERNDVCYDCYAEQIQFLI